MTFAPALVSIEDAAHALNLTPWEVVRLLESGLLKSVQLVEASSVQRHQENAR